MRKYTDNTYYMFNQNTPKTKKLMTREKDSKKCYHITSVNNINYYVTENGIQNMPYIVNIILEKSIIFQNSQNKLENINLRTNNNQIFDTNNKISLEYNPKRKSDVVGINQEV